jgi:hypothetical protein
LALSWESEAQKALWQYIILVHLEISTRTLWSLFCHICGESTHWFFLACCWTSHYILTIYQLLIVFS